MINTIHCEWPELIEPYRWPRNMHSGDKFSNEMILESRKAGLQSLVEVNDGTVYLPFGGGYSTAKTSLRVMEQVSNQVRYIKKLEEHVKSNVDLVVGAASDASSKLIDEYIFKLHIDSTGWYVDELNSNSRVLIAL